LSVLELRIRQSKKKSVQVVILARRIGKLGTAIGNNRLRRRLFKALPPPKETNEKANPYSDGL
jgi:hypothetical protein